MSVNEYYSVSSLNRYIKTLFDHAPNLQNIYVKGEVSNFKRYSSGHCYFTIRDSESMISAVMFVREASSLKFEPKDGDEVIACGSVTIYPSRGAYQLYVQSMDLFGKGAYLLELEERKKRLYNEGLFDTSRKRTINIYPTSVGVITAKNSAAIKDIISNLTRRYPLVTIYVFPSLVQGADAPASLLKAVLLANTYPLDTLIIGRGGGASEDLDAFNDEALVRAVANSRIPTIAAVGHEIDMTLVDYVADKRASTPTGAAELATIDKREIYERLAYAKDSLSSAINERIKDYRNDIAAIKSMPFFIDPSSIYRDEVNNLAHLKSILIHNFKSFCEYKKQEIDGRKKKLDALNPYKVLSRGYSIMKNSSGHIVTKIEDVADNELVSTIVANGVIISKVAEKEKK